MNYNVIDPNASSILPVYAPKTPTGSPDWTSGLYYANDLIRTSSKDCQLDDEGRYCIGVNPDKAPATNSGGVSGWVDWGLETVAGIFKLVKSPNGSAANTATGPNQQACPQDAVQCPGGMFGPGITVTRTGPGCTFPQCPPNNDWIVWLFAGAIVLILISRRG